MANKTMKQTLAGIGRDLDELELYREAFGQLDVLLISNNLFPQVNQGGTKAAVSNTMEAVRHAVRMVNKAHEVAEGTQRLLVDGELPRESLAKLRGQLLEFYGLRVKGGR